jgi:tetratricopeptide (TPR) repeat protein
MNDAIARYQKMLEEDPDNDLTRFSLGKALFDQGDYAQAREHLSLALATRPDWMAAQILLARCWLYLGNKEAARPALERAHELARKQGHVGPLAQVEELLRQFEGKPG